MSSKPINTHLLIKKRTGFMAPMLVMVLLGIVLLFVFQSDNAARKDPLHTDLTASAIYAKMGFLPSYAKLTNPGSVDWGLVRPPHSGPVIMSDLPEPKTYARYGQFSTANREIKEFTIFVPFTLNQTAFQHLNGSESIYPSLYLASIGENWEIFLNGHSVARQIFLDKAGRISEFRNVHGISIPVEKEYLHAGNNFLVIHILGAYSSKWTGLRYASPYYLGDSSYTFSNYTGIANMVMCAVFLFTALFHLLIYAFRRTDRYNWLFVGFTVIASLYYFAETQILYSVLPNTEYGQRLDYGLMYVLIFTGAAFLETINAGKISKVTAAYGVFSTAFAVGQWFFPIWFAYGLVSVWRYTTVLYAAYVIIFDLLLQIYKGAVQLSEDARPKPGFWRGIYRYLSKTEFGQIYIMLLLVGLTMIIDIINIAVFNLNFPLKNYSLLGFTMGMAYILARKYSRGPENALRESIAAGNQNLTTAGLTAEETNVVMLMMEGLSTRDIARKLHMDAAVVSRYGSAARQKLNLMDDLDPILADLAMEYNLTKRETEMLKYLRDNTGTEKIAAELFISEGTVRSHIRSLLIKLGIEKRQDVAAWLEERRPK